MRRAQGNARQGQRLRSRPAPGSQARTGPDVASRAYEAVALAGCARTRGAAPGELCVAPRCHDRRHHRLRRTLPDGATGRLGAAGEALDGWIEARLNDAGYVVAWVDVAGARRVDASEVADLIGAAPGAGLAGIDPQEARARLEALSWVEHAQVLRLWPDRVGVILTEREPFALWQNNQIHHVIDRSGVVIEAADPAEFAELPIVIGEGAPQETASLMAILDLNPEIASRTTHRVRVGDRRWSLRLASGGEVLLPEGDPGGALAQLSAMHAERGVLDYEAQIIDLRVDGEMVLRPWPDRTAEPGRGA